MAVIDSNNFITHLVWSGLIDKATCGELKEAIEQCTVKDIYTKADMVVILDKIRAEIETDWQLKKYPSSPFSCGLRRAIEIIDKYKAETETDNENIMD